MDYTYHPVSLAADTTDYQAGTFTRINAAISKGAPAAAISGAMSIYNTFLDYTGQDQASIEDAVRRFGGDEMGDYYQENKNAVDLVGFIGTALVPGSLGVKGLQLARAGITTGNVGKFLNLASSNKRKYLEAALQETAQSGGVIKNLLTKNRLKYLGWETADQAMLATAAELAIAGTMNDSPVFEGDSLGNFAWNIGLGAGLGGVIGGAVGSIAAKGILRSAQTEIQAAARLQDVISDTQKLGLSKGTDALVMAESLITLPQPLGNLDFTYKLDGVLQRTTLNTDEAFKRIRMEAEHLGKDKLAMKFNALAQGDERIGQAYFEFMQTAVQASKEAGLQPSEIVQKLNGYLANLEKIQALDLERIALDKRKFYVSSRPVGGTPLEQLTGMFSTKRTRDTLKSPYVLADDVTASDLNIYKADELVGDSIKQIFRNNPDADLIQLADGSFRVNPKSSRIIKLKENPVQITQLIDLETGSLTNETAAVIGDILKKGKLQFTQDALWVNGQKFDMPSSKASTMADSPLESSARWAWVSQMEAGALKKAIGGEVDAYDFPVLTRLAELVESGKLQDAQLRTLRLMDNGNEVDWNDLVSLRQFIEQKRVEWLEVEFTNWKEGMGSVPDTRVLAAHLNTDYQWIENIIERGFMIPSEAELARTGQVLGKVYDTAQALKPRTVMATWDFGWTPNLLPEEAYNMNMGPSHLITKELTKEYQRTVRRTVNETAAKAVLGQDADQFSPAEQFLSLDTSISGAGATLFGASNAGYGEKAKLWVQNTGKSVALVSQRRIDATIESLSPHINALRESPEAAAELGIVTNMLRKSKYRYVMDPDNLDRLISTDVIRDARKNNVSIDEVLARAPEIEGSPASIPIENPAVRDFLNDSAKINHARQQKFATLHNAAGLTRNLDDLPVVYAPPINTVKYPYHAFVKTKQKLGLASDVGMITAKSEDQLRTLAASIGDDFDVFFKQDTENYFKIKGEYDYQMTLHESAVQSELARRGKLADAFPETRFENINEDWLQWHARQEEKLVRDAVQVQSREFFSELRLLSEQYRKVSESVSRGIGSRFKSKVADPFGDYIKTALNISKQQEFPLLDSLNDFVDKVGVTVGDAINKGFRDAKAGIISWEDANRIMADKGMGTFYKDWDQYLTANEKYPKNAIRTFFQKANMALATTMLRFDFANSLVNIISTPIMLGTEMASIKKMIANDDVLAGKLRELTTVRVPGQNARVPSTTHLIGGAINNFFSQQKDDLLTRYKDIGAVKDVSSQYHQMLDMVSYDPKIGMSKWGERVDKGVELAAKLSGNTFAEDFTRFVSADVMRQLSDPLVEAGRMTVKEQNAYISTFVNRVQGNYVTSQRPIVFQGTTGAAVSLFQTYAFNVLQQLYRHMERGDKRTLAIFAGLQGSIFGLNGLPFFDAVNTYLIGGMIANNPQHKDAYSVLPEFNYELGNWMLYGTASAFPLFSGSSPAFFTRGDMNPRHMLILPTAIADVPAVSASLKLVNSLIETGKNIGGGADVSDALLNGLEHQGWNRPLAGFAQLLAGRSTDNKGALISASIDMETTSMLGSFAERAISLEGATRLMGARPMDEAVALNAMYRNKSYEAMDRARIERLGEVVKTKLYNNEVPTTEELEDFMLRYTRSGGRIENFSQAMQRWSRDANVSIVNQLSQKLGSPYAAKLQVLMGGEELPDYRNNLMMQAAELSEE